MIMRAFTRVAVRAAAIAFGFLLFAAAPAQAYDQSTEGNSGAGSGNNFSVPVNAAVNFCGNGIGATGDAEGRAGACSAAEAGQSGGAEQSAKDNKGAASGMNLRVPANVAGNFCGNGIGVASEGKGRSGGCSAVGSGKGRGNGVAMGALGGNQRGESAEDAGGLIAPPATLPVPDAGTPALGVPAGSYPDKPGKGGQSTKDNSGIFSGNNFNIPINVAVNLCNTAIGVAGDALAQGGGGCYATKVSNRGGESGQSADGNQGVASGNNFSIPVNAAVNVCGLAIGATGDAKAAGGDCSAQAAGKPGRGPEEELPVPATDVPVAAPAVMPSDDGSPVGTAQNAVGGLLDGVDADAQGNDVSLPGVV